MSGLNWQRRWDPFRDFQREVGRLFETFEPLTQWRVERSFPAVNLYDAGANYILTAQLPGVGPENVELTITGDTLTLLGERKQTEGVAEESFRRQERQHGRWVRTVTLPDRVESSSVTATFTNGILTVTLPKLETSLPRHINVTALPA
jgi:HSP20 family protein